MKKVFAREELCVNCHLCEVYCKTAHSASGDVLTANKYEDPAPISRVKVYGDRVASVAVNCRHCDDPACVKACITGAMHKDKKTGIVSVDPDKCIGCMTCLAVCPIGCIQSGNIAYKCDLCGGEEPACVKGCPNRALVWVEAGGASAAGLAAAEQIRKTDPAGAVTLLTRETDLPYSRPSISYYLKGLVRRNQMRLRTPAYYKEQKIEIVTDVEVTAIDRAKKTVKCGRKSYSYDKLCLCTGSVPFVPPMQNVSGKRNVCGFLTAADAQTVHDLASANTRAVVIGAGLIGMKAAEGLSKICKSVDVVELSDRVLPSILDEKSAKLVRRHLEHHGLRFHLGQTVTRAKCSGKTVQRVVLQNGKELPCDLLVVAVGVRPATALAEAAGLTVERGIITDPATMQTSDPDIYAAGDCAVSVDMLDGSKKILALWPNAVAQGRAAGSQMAGGDLTVGGTYAVNAIDFYGLRICTCGLINAKGDGYTDRVTAADNSYKRLVFRDGKLVGYVLINASENAGIYTSLISGGVPLEGLQGDLMDSPNLFWFPKETRIAKLRGGVQL